MIRALALFFLCSPFCLKAQLPVARLFTIFPPGGRAGSSVEVEVAGQDLEAPHELHFSDRRITAQHLDGPKFKVLIPPGLEPFVCDVRVSGKFGMSNPRSFAIDQLPEIPAPATNTSLEAAFPVAINSILNGRAIAEAFQFYRFPATQGQHLVISCQASGLDSRLNPSLRLLDANGKELTGKFSGDLIDLRVARTGEYFIKLSDSLYKGGAEYFYRLIVSTRPHIDYVFPPAAVPGSKAKLALFGRNLPGGSVASNITMGGTPLDRLEVEIDVPQNPEIKPGTMAAMLRPAAAQVDGFEYRLDSSNGVSNPIFISFARSPAVAEREPNDKPGAAQVVKLPCTLAGQFFPANDRDWVQFTARKEDVVWVEVTSQRLGLPTAPFVVVQRVTTNSSGEEKVTDVREAAEPEGVPEFKIGSLDPAWRFEAKEDGVYRLEIRDQFNSRSDPRRVYLVSLRKEDPDFSLIAVAQPSAPAKKDSKEATIVVPFLRKGETIPLRIVALRRGLKGPIEISAFGLPESIEAAPARIGTGTNSTMLFLTAMEDSPGWAGSFEILGMASMGSRQLVRQARLTTTIWNSGDTSVEPAQTRLARNVALAASAEEPASITIAPSENRTYEASAGTKLQIPCTVTRHGEFTAPLKLKPLGLPSTALKETEIDGKATNSVLQLDLAKIQPGDYLFVLNGDAQGKYLANTNSGTKPKDVTVSVYSKPIDLHVTPAPSK